MKITVNLTSLPPFVAVLVGERLKVEDEVRQEFTARELHELRRITYSEISQILARLELRRQLLCSGRQ